MINKYVIANLKMHMTAKDISAYLKIINQKFFVSNVIICPTSIYIPYFLNQHYDVGIQNVYFENEGQFTGEISPMQAKSIGVGYVIIGHNDRRIMGETDQIINLKIKKALENNLKVIFCIGETIEQREMLKTDKVLKQQIINGLRDLSKVELQNVFVAYEPVWSVGTNDLPTIKEITDCVEFIRSICKNNLDAIPFIIYGGSINDKNIVELNKIKNIDGFLIGAASCDANKLIRIIELIDGQ